MKIAFATFSLLLALVLSASAQDLKLGMIGTDTSHSTAFAGILHDSSRPDHVSGARIVAAFKGGSPDIKSSAERVDQFAEELKTKHNVKLVDKITDLCPLVDGILLESVDGRAHLPQFREAVKCGKPVFIDKPIASTWKDVLEIAAIAKKAGVPWFSTSSLRYASFVDELKGGAQRGAITWGPGPHEEHHELILSWYAVHPVEVLFTLMGPGCQKASLVTTDSGDLATCVWKDGRTGTVRTLIPYGDYGAAVFGEKATKQSPANPKFSYAPMLSEIVTFMRTKQPPVPNDVTMEIFAFMEAANRSKKQNGAMVALPTWK